MKLYRPVNQEELDLIIASNWTRFPLRLVGESNFYPVLNEAYANQISKEWNVPSYGIGHVVQFEIADSFLKNYKIQNVGGEIHNELWILAGDMDAMHNNLIGQIELIRTFL